MTHGPERQEGSLPGKGHRHRGRSSEQHLDKDRILQALGLRDGQTVLDAGCGSGYMSWAFARQVGPSGRVFALDPDEEAIGALREQARGTRIEARVGDITKRTPLDDASVDVLYVSNVLHGFSGDQLRAFLQEARRVLRPAGLLAVVEIERHETPFGPPMDIRLPPEELRRAVPWTPGETIRVGQHFYLQLFTRSSAGRE